MTVDLIVNCYERTYREVLAPNFFSSLCEQNDYAFDGCIALINNVDDLPAARQLAEQRIRAGEISSYYIVSDLLPNALRATGMTGRALGRRPYFVDYGLVMSLAGDSDFIVGWDAEVRLTSASDWVTPALHLLKDRSDVFSAAPRWPRRGFDSLDEETVETCGDWALNWAFSDQVFMVRRDEISSPIYRRFALASIARHANHPYSFEARLESYQRTSRRFRASHATIEYVHNDLDPVIPRLDGYSRLEGLRRRGLTATRRVLANRFDYPPLRLP